MKIFSKKNLKNPKGFTLIELLIVIAIIGILASVAFPQFAQYRARSFGSQVEAELHSIYLACKAFWGDNTSTADCTQALITVPLYGFVSNAAVTPAFTAGATSQEAAFAVTATHASLPAATFYTVNQNGTIIRTGNLG